MSDISQKIMNFLISAFIHRRNNNRTTLLIYCSGPYVFDVNERISSSLNYPDNSHLQRRQNFMKKADSSFTCLLRDGNSISCQYFRCTLYKCAEAIKNPQIYVEMT